MKIIYLTLFLPLFAISQNIKSGYVEYDYQLPANKIIKKDATLYFNENKSIFSYDKKEADSIIKNESKIDGNDIKLKLKSGDEVGTIFYRDYSKKEIVFRIAKMGNLFEAYTVEDTWISINWSILEEFKEIGKFKCQKAIGDFRGRTYIAWFTEEIPLSYGPWKLFGLPGLILEAEDTEKMFKVEFKSIKYPCDCKIATELPTSKDSKTLKEYVEFRDNFNQKVLAKIQSRLSRKIKPLKLTSDKGTERKYRDEKIFEWEIEVIDEKKN